MTKISSNISTEGILRKEMSIHGRLKYFSDWIAGVLIIIALAVLVHVSFPWSFISGLLWIYCLLLVLTVILRPKWWLFIVIFSLPVLGFIPNWQGVAGIAGLSGFNDGSFVSLSHLVEMKHLGHNLSGINDKIFSIPLFGLPLSMGIWWIRQKDILLPRSIISISVFFSLMIFSAISVVFRFYEISLVPFHITFIGQDFMREVLPKATKLVSYKVVPRKLISITAIITLANIEGVLLFLVIYNVIKKGITIKVASNALLAAVVVFTSFGFAQMMGWFPSFTTVPGRFESTFLDLGESSVFCGLSTAFTLGLIFSTDNRKVMIFYGLVFVFALLGFSVVKSRTSLVGFTGSLICLSLIYRKLRSADSTTKKILFFFVYALVAFLIIVSIPKVNHYVQGRLDKGSFGMRVMTSLDFTRMSLDGISSGRITLWKHCLVVWKKHPIMGCGMGQLPWELLKTKYKEYPWPADNQFILELAELGVVGLLAFLWMIYALIKDISMSLHLYMGEKKTIMNYLPWLCGFISIILEFFTIFVLYYRNVILIVWATFAIAVALSPGSGYQLEGPKEKSV